MKDGHYTGTINGAQWHLQREFGLWWLADGTGWRDRLHPEEVVTQAHEVVRDPLNPWQWVRAQVAA